MRRRYKGQDKGQDKAQRLAVPSLARSLRRELGVSAQKSAKTDCCAKIPRT